jgi:hypothetical protein
MEKFEKKLNDKILSQFIGAKEWGDLLSIIKELLLIYKKRNRKKRNKHILNNRQRNIK